MQSSIIGIRYKLHFVLSFTVLKLVINRSVPSGLDTNIEEELKPLLLCSMVLFSSM